MNGGWEPPALGGLAVHPRRRPIPVILAGVAGALAVAAMLVLAIDLQLNLWWLAENAGGLDSDQLTASVFGRVGMLTILRSLAATVLLAGTITVFFRARTGAALIMAGGVGGALCVLLTYWILGKSRGTVDHYTELFFGSSQWMLSWAVLVACFAAALLAALGMRSAGPQPP